MTAQSHIAVGFRFDRRDAKLLRAIATIQQSLGRPAEALDKAASAAEHDEPLIVFCTDADEARREAHRFTRFGVAAPAIEQLSGVR